MQRLRLLSALLLVTVSGLVAAQPLIEEEDLAQAYAVQSTEEAMEVDRFADEYWGGAVEYADGYPGEIVEEWIGEEAVVVESVDPVLPMSEAVIVDSKTVTVSPRRGGWKKGF